jgi:hypothetical protein
MIYNYILPPCPYCMENRNECECRCKKCDSWIFECQCTCEKCDKSCFQCWCECRKCNNSVWVCECSVAEEIQVDRDEDGKITIILPEDDKYVYPDTISIIENKIIISAIQKDS